MYPIDTLIERSRERKLSVAVIGDAMLDVWNHGHVEQCQDGCPRFINHDTPLNLPGGAALAASQLDRWNVKVSLMAITGGISDLGRLGGGLDRKNSTRSGFVPIKERFVADGRIVMRHDREGTAYGLSDDKLNDCRRTVVSALEIDRFDAVLISDYDKGLLDGQTVRKIIDHCIEHDIPVVADGKKPPTSYLGAVLKVNSAYAAQHPEVSSHTPAAVVTYGAEDPVIVGESSDYIDQGSNTPVVCRNHVGAGDCFAAHLAFALGHGLPIEQAVSIAHAAGRVYVQSALPRAPWPHEVRRDLHPVRGKIIDPADLEAISRSAAGKLAFANGVFRVPHAGHAWLLDFAKGQYGRHGLVVAVDSDENVARTRPGQFALLLSERCAMLAALECVDWVVPFSGSVRDIVTLLRPSVVVKGSEYRSGGVAAIPGHDLAEVVFAPESPFPRHCTGLVEEVRDE